MRLPNEHGGVSHAELDFAGGVLMLGAAGLESPESSGVDPPVFVHLYVDDLDAHYTRAKEAGAEIAREPENQFYGDRTYRAKHPEG